MIVDGRGYWRLGRATLSSPSAPRGASAWGDDAVRRLFSAGGGGPQSGGIGFDLDAIGLIRGFETDDVIGPRAAVVNADYRVPLAWIERGVGTWPLFCARSTARCSSTPARRGIGRSARTIAARRSAPSCRPTSSSATRCR